MTATAQFTGVTTDTSKWTKGEPVIVNGEFNPKLKGKEGTAVATFDVIYLKDSPKDVDVRLSEYLSQGCDGPRWVGFDNHQNDQKQQK